MTRPSPWPLIAVVSLVACPDDPPKDPELVPSEYAPLEAPASTLKPQEVRELFEINCATCHGTDGKGDGPASEALELKPAAFRHEGFLAERSDRYLFWRLSEGKRGTPMPAFKYNLSPEQRWALVRYLRDQWGPD